MYEEDYDFREDHTYSSHDDYNYDRETFYALTEGMYGDYNEFLENGGDLDFLMDSLGF